MKNMVDTEKTGAFRCGTFSASDQRQIAVGDFLGKMSIIDLENHSKVKIRFFNGETKLTQISIRLFIEEV